MNEIIQNTLQTADTSTHVTKTPTQLSKHPHIKKPKHTHTHTHITKPTNTHTHPHTYTPTHYKTHTHTPTPYKTHTYTHPHITKPTHTHTHTYTHNHTVQNKLKHPQYKIPNKIFTMQLWTFPLISWYKYLIRKKEVKCTLVQALSLCTGRTAHMGSRGIALLFLDRGTRWGEGSTSPHGRFLPPVKNRYPL